MYARLAYLFHNDIAPCYYLADCLAISGDISELLVIVLIYDSHFLGSREGMALSCYEFRSSFQRDIIPEWLSITSSEGTICL